MRFTPNHRSSRQLRPLATAVAIVTSLGFGGHTDINAQTPPIPGGETPNIRHYMTPNFEFYAEEPDWAPQPDNIVRTRIYLMPHIYLSKYDGVTLYFAGETPVERLLENVLWATPFPENHPLHGATADEPLLERIRESDRAIRSLTAGTRTDQDIRRDQATARRSIIRKEAQRIAQVIQTGDNAHSARVWFSTAPPVLTHLHRQEILSAIYNIDPSLAGDPTFVYDKIQDKSVLPGFSQTKSHSFELLPPNNFTANLYLGSGEAPVASIDFAGAVGARSSFGFSLDDLTDQDLQLLGRGHFTITLEGRVNLSRVQELSAGFDFDAFAKQLSENLFRRVVTTESKSGRRWFKKYTRTSLQTHVETRQQSFSSSGLATSINIRSRDLNNPELLNRMYEFVFPQSTATSVEALIARHLAEANKPGQDPETKRMHEQYVNHLRTIADRNYDALQQSEDAFKNAFADAQDDEKKAAVAKAIISLLQTGFGGSLDTSNHTLEIRELRSRDYYESRSRTLNALIFESSEAAIAVSRGRFFTAPFESTDSYDLASFLEHLLTNQVDRELGSPLNANLPDIPDGRLKSFPRGISWPPTPWGPFDDIIRDGVEMQAEQATPE